METGKLPNDQKLSTVNPIPKGNLPTKESLDQ